MSFNLLLATNTVATCIAIDIVTNSTSDHATNYHYCYCLLSTDQPVILVPSTNSQATPRNYQHYAIGLSLLAIPTRFKVPVSW